MSNSNGSPFSGKVIAILLAISILSFGAVFVLAGWAPDLGNKDKAGAHPFSSSAIGYGGFVSLLEDMDYPVEVSRLERTLSENHGGLLVITPNRASDINDLSPYGPVLYVLPKWNGIRDRMKDSWQKHTYFRDAKSINLLIAKIADDAEILRLAPSTKIQSPFSQRQPVPDIKLQLIKSENLETIAGNRQGALLAKVPGEEVYILSDPDLINTFGLSKKANAHFAVEMVDYIRAVEYRPVIFDATVHGFIRSENLLKMVFDIPFIGATLTALAAVILLGWSALLRFGPPLREDRAIALGKQALIDNSANLIQAAGRTRHFAPNYLSLIKRRTARDIGAPAGLTDAQLTALFDRMQIETESQTRFSDIEKRLLEPIPTIDDLISRVSDLYKWRQQIIGRLQ